MQMTTSNLFRRAVTLVFLALIVFVAGCQSMGSAPSGRGLPPQSEMAPGAF
jgi:hypothetical protein